MKAAVWMIVVCAATGAGAVWLADEGARAAIVAGMIGPLTAACATWIAVERTVRVNPAGLTGMMMSAFVVKMLAFGAYVVVVVRVLALPVAPFGLSFTGYFVGLYATEAVMLRRLLASMTPAVRA